MKRTLTACCVGHFLVDFSCAFLLFRMLRGEAAWGELLLVYNFCAFAVQMPLGLLADRWDRDGAVAAAGVLLVLLAHGLIALPWAAVTVVGLGNAAFHVGGGLETLSLSGDRAGPLGLFVAPGAVGLFFGTLLGRDGRFPLWPLPFLLLFTASALLWTRLGRPERPETQKAPAPRPALPLLLLLAVVALRSYVGMTLTFPWKGEGHWALVLVLALALGKAAGGYLADRFGVLRTAAVSLALSAALLPAAGLPACGAASVFLFNMTMPLTLWASARLLPQTRGFAFGLLTFGLFLGYVPAVFGAPALSGPAAALWALVSLALLLPGLKKAAGT